MKIVIATGIYPPQIGGPATYAKALAQELSRDGHDVTVVTYGDAEQGKSWKVETVSKSAPLIRWWWYSQKLRDIAADADVIYALSSVSCGIPLVLSGLKKPKRVLRLGGDFLWERYTDWGGKKSLRDFYASAFILGKWCMGWLLRRFHYIIFSTQFQKDIYDKAYSKLPQSTVIENALSIDVPLYENSTQPHNPFRLLFVGRTVRFKNLPSLIDAVAQMPDCVLSIVGEGPMDQQLRKQVEYLGIHTRVRFVAPVSGKEKLDIFAQHDTLILPSLTDISPNTALEAHAFGLPVLLTKEMGLSPELCDGMKRVSLLLPGDIVKAVTELRDHFAALSRSKGAVKSRSWKTVAQEHIEQFTSL